MCASDSPPEELWLKHKEYIYACYIVEGLTLKKTMAAVRDVHGFHAR
jgi:Clr5 domain